MTRVASASYRMKGESNSTGSNATRCDAIVVGAGHNGLAAAAVLARRGLDVLVVEKNNYVGGMAGTREILSGCRNDVGASLLFPLAREVSEELEFERYGVEYIDLPVMACDLGAADAAPLLMYSNPLRQAAYVLRHFGLRTMIAFVRFMAFIQYPARAMHRFTPCALPPTYEQLLAEAPGPAEREKLRLAFEGSAMDLIDRFFPDRKRQRTIRALLSFAAIQSTYKGPYSAGSALCLVYTFAMNESGGLMRRPKGGMGSLSEALAKSIEDHGGTIRLRSAARRIVIEDGRAVGVELAGGEIIKAQAVLSNLDQPATFLTLVGAEHLSDDFVKSVEKREHRGAYVHMLLKLSRLPRYAGNFAWLERSAENHFNATAVTDPELMQSDYEACLRGELPLHPPVAMQIPTVLDPGLSPDGTHIATIYGFYFPCEAPKSDRGRLRDQMAERILDRLSSYMPDLRECIIEKAVFSSDHFATMHGATGGDFTHGLIHPDQMLGARTMVEGSAHATPVDGLYLCGSACHPGPGVTFLPGYSCAREVVRVLDSRTRKDSAAVTEESRSSSVSRDEQTDVGQAERHVA